MQRLKYPVLIYNEKFILGQISRKNKLQSVSRKSCERRMYDDLVIVDSDLKTYTVLSHENSYPWTTLAINTGYFFTDLFMQKRGDYATWVDFELSEPEQLTCGEIKNRIACDEVSSL